MKKILFLTLALLFAQLAQAASYSVTATSTSAVQQINPGLTSVTITNSGPYVVTARAGGSAAVATDYDTQIQPNQAISVSVPVGAAYIAYRSMGGGWFGSASSTITISEDSVDLSKANPMRGDRVGTTTNDSAAAGAVGEYITASLSAASAVSLTTTVAANVVSTASPLAVGEYDASGVICYHGQSGVTTINDVLEGINTTSATVPGIGDYAYDAIGIAAGTEDWCYVTPLFRISLASPTTAYLVGRSDFSGGTLTAYGKLRVRRIR